MTGLRTSAGSSEDEIGGFKTSRTFVEGFRGRGVGGFEGLGLRTQLEALKTKVGACDWLQALRTSDLGGFEDLGWRFRLGDLLRAYLRYCRFQTWS